MLTRSPIHSVIRTLTYVRLQRALFGYCLKITRRSSVRDSVRPHAEAGFTLVELIAILIIVGILAVTALPRFFDTNTFVARSFVDEAQSTLRYAQKVAIAQRRNVFVIFSGSGAAFCLNNAGCGTPVMTATNKPASLNLPSGVTASLNRSIAGFYFNALGRPYDIGNTEPNSTFARTTITLSGGGATRTIIVEPETGYVHQ
jgi:MSHA pilin protein MshC